MPRGKRECTAEVWSERVRRWRESGLTSSAFAEQEGIARPQTLSWWAWRLSKESGEKARRRARERKPKLRLVRIEAETLVAEKEAAAEIVTATGVRVLVTSRTSEEAVRCALRALGVGA
jgi:transposase